MAADLRSSFHACLDELNGKLASMFELVANSLAMFSDAAPVASPDLTAALADRELEADALYGEVEELVQWHLARQQAMGRDLRLLLTAVHIAPELERSHDLVVHAAHESRLIGDCPAERQAEFARMATLAAEMWRALSVAFSQHDPQAAADLALKDTQMDALQRSILAGLGGDPLEHRYAMRLALLARFLERLGDHAVHLAKRIRFLAVGE